MADLVKRFGNVVATDQVSLRVEPGEAVGLIGPNGSGKSTLLKMIAGIERPDGGSVTLGETALRGRAPYEVSRLGIAVAMQVPRPFADLTVRENVRIAAGHHAGSGRASGRRSARCSACAAWTTVRTQRQGRWDCSTSSDSSSPARSPPTRPSSSSTRSPPAWSVRS